MSDALAQALADALQAARAMDEGRIRAIVREELATAGNSVKARPGWMTPPAAAKALGIGVKRVRALIDGGQVQTRARNLQPSSAKQLKLEVLVESVEIALRGHVEKVRAPVDAADWARKRAARKEAVAR